MLRMKRGLILSDGEEEGKSSSLGSTGSLHRFHHIHNTFVQGFGQLPAIQLSAVLVISKILRRYRTSGTADTAEHIIFHTIWCTCPVLF